jgi:hypothetical protein
MSETRTVYFRTAAGEINPVTLPALEAVTACHKHPHEYSLDGKTFAPAPEGFVASIGNGGGLGRLAGASVRAD